MTDVRQRLVDRTRFLFAVPSTDVALVAAVLLGAALGAVALGPTVRGAVAGLVVLAAPAVVATLWTGPLDQTRDGTFDLDRSALLALAASTIVATFVLAASAVRELLHGGPAVLVDAVLLAAAGTFAFRLLVLVAVSGPPLVDRLTPAVVQPAALVGVVVLVAVGTGHAIVTPVAFGITAVAAALYVGVAVGVVALVDYPMSRDWGVSGFEFIHRFLEYLADGATDVESVFASLGQRAEVPVSVLAFRTPDGAEKARVVVPLAHPGPLPDLGGGTLPYRLAEDGEGLVFTPHGLAGHAYDPATHDDVDEVVAAAARAAERVTCDATAAKPIVARAGSATVCGQTVGDGSFLVTSFAPAATDDVSRPVGLDAIEAAAPRGGTPLVTDAHNARPSDGINDGITTPGSPRADDLVAAVERAATALDHAERGDLRVGVATDPTSYGTREGIGPLGVRVLATAVDDATAAYVLVDGNNMVPALRETVREAVRASLDVDVLSVATTDTHAVNHLDATNYVGTGIDSESFAAKVVETTARALDDLEPAAAGAASATATITVLGEGTIDGIAAFTDRILPICGWFVLVSSLVTTGVAAALFWIAGAW